MKKKIQKRNEVLQIFWGGRVNTDSLYIACDFCPWDVRKLGDETVHKDIKKRRNIDTSLWGSKTNFLNILQAPLERMQDDLLLRYPHVNRKIFPLTPKSTRCSSIKSEFALSKALLGPGTKQHSYRRGECIAPVNNGVCLCCGRNIYNVDEFVLKLIHKDGTPTLYRSVM